MNKKQLALMELEEKNKRQAASLAENPSNQSDLGIPAEDIKFAEEQAALTQKYGERPVAAAVLAAGDVISFGVLGQLAKRTGAVSEETLRELPIRNPDATTLGTVGGIGATILGSMGTATPAVGARAALGLGARAAEGAGLAVEKAIADSALKYAAKLSEKKLVSSIVQKSIAKGMGSAVEGAAWSTGQLLHEDAIGAADLTGENLLAYAGTGAVLNGLIGGAFGGISAAAPKMLNKIDQTTGQFKRKLDNLVDPDDAMGKLAGFTAKKTSEYKASGAMETMRDIYKKAGVAVLDSAAEAAEKVSKYVDESSSKLDDLYTRVDELGFKSSANDYVVDALAHLDEVASRPEFRERMVQAGAKSAFNTEKSALMNRFDRDAGKNYGLETLREIKGSYNVFDKKSSTISNDLKKEMYRFTNEYMSKKADDFAETLTMGTPEELAFAKKIKELNKELSAGIPLKKGLSEESVRGSKYGDLRDLVLGSGAMLASMSDLTSISGAIAGTLGIKKIMESNIARTLSVLGAAERANTAAKLAVKKSVENTLTSKIKTSASVAKKAVAPIISTSGFAFSEGKPPKDKKEAFANIQKNLEQWTTQPEILASKIALNTMKTGQIAPNATSFIRSSIANAVQFLASKVPKNSNSVGDIFATKKDWQPSTMELAKFSRYLQAIENPYSTLSDLEAGTLTREHVEALEAVYPAILTDIRQEVIRQISSDDKKIPYNKRVSMGILLGIPADISLSPTAIAALQLNFKTEDQGNEGVVDSTTGGVGKINKSERLETNVQASSGKIE